MIEALTAAAASVETSSNSFPLWMIGLLGLGIGAGVLAVRRSRPTESSD